MDKKRMFRNGELVDVYYDEKWRRVLDSLGLWRSKKFRTVSVAKNQ